jgi:tetratricopeptide (TPR) repeat protein
VSHISDLEAAISADPTYANAYGMRAFCHRAMGRFDEAAADYQRAIDLEPNPKQREHYQWGLGRAEQRKSGSQ